MTALMLNRNQNVTDLVFKGKVTFANPYAEDVAGCQIEFLGPIGGGGAARISLNGGGEDGYWSLTEPMYRSRGTSRFRTRVDVSPYAHRAHVQVLVHHDKLRLVEHGTHQHLLLFGEWYEGQEDAEKSDDSWCSFHGLLPLDSFSTARPISMQEHECLKRLYRMGRLGIAR